VKTKNRNRKIKLIIFDSGEIILKLDWKKINRLIDKFYLERGADLRKQHKLWDKYGSLAWTGKLPHLKVNQLIARGLGLPISVAEEFRKWDHSFWKKEFSLFPGEKQTLKKLQNDGYKLAILTDTIHTARYVRSMYRYFGIEKFFHRFFSSKDIVYTKPHPKSFQIVLKSFNVKPENTVFVCHSLDEIHGGKKLGMQVICFGDEHAKKAHYHAKRFSDIYKIIKEIDDETK
jgi:HAD superfamily hydrolase (TIGR01549 family)